MKVVINRCFGGFGLSTEAFALIAELKVWKHACDDYDQDYWFDENGKPVHEFDLSRSDTELVAAVELLGKNADGDFALLKVVKIPDNISWTIHNYDGMEEIHETHRSWC